MKSGGDLSADWNDITSGMEQYGQGKLGYSPLGLNINTAANAGLQADKLSPSRGQTGTYTAPPYERTPFPSWCGSENA